MQTGGTAKHKFRCTQGPCTFSAEHWFEYALTCEQAGRLADAACGYQKALALEPHWPEAHFNRGNVLRSLGRLRQAVSEYESAIAIEPCNPLAWYNLGDVLDELGDIQRAIHCLRQAVAIDPLFADSHFNLASCCHAAGMKHDAAKHWRMYLKLDRSGEWAAYAQRMLTEMR